MFVLILDKETISMDPMGDVVKNIVKEKNLEKIVPICFTNFCNLNGDCRVINLQLICSCYEGYYGINCQHRSQDYQYLLNTTSKSYN
jgi:hypothetical protein